MTTTSVYIASEVLICFPVFERQSRIKVNFKAILCWCFSRCTESNGGEQGPVHGHPHGADVLQRQRDPVHEQDGHLQGEDCLLPAEELLPRVQGARGLLRRVAELRGQDVRGSQPVPQVQEGHLHALHLRNRFGFMWSATPFFFSFFRTVDSVHVCDLFCSVLLFFVSCFSHRHGEHELHFCRREGHDSHVQHRAPEHWMSPRILEDRQNMSRIFFFLRLDFFKSLVFVSDKVLGLRWRWYFVEAFFLAQDLQFLSLFCLLYCVRWNHKTFCLMSSARWDDLAKFHLISSWPHTVVFFIPPSTKMNLMVKNKKRIVFNS